MNWRLGMLIAACAFAVVGLLMVGGFPVGEVLAGLVTGSMGNLRVLGQTLREMTPLLIAGTAVFVALRAGMFNIGVEGQFLMGAMVCAAIALRVPGGMGMAFGVLGALAAGALWALPAGLIKAYRNGHEVITTIMLNNIAGFITTALVAGPLRDPTQQSTTTADLATTLPMVMQSPQVSLALVLGLGFVAVLWFWLRKTVAGFELEAVGANPRAAPLAGIEAKLVQVRALSASGAIAGLAGDLQVLAFEGRFYKDFSQGYGFDSLGVALLAGSNPFGLIPAAFCFGAIKKGAASIGVFHEVPKGISLVILGLAIVAFAAIRYRKHVGRTAE